MKIPKLRLIFKIQVFKIGNPRPYDTRYVKQENIHYWVDNDYEEDGDQVIITKVWMHPKRYESLF